MQKKSPLLLTTVFSGSFLGLIPTVQAKDSPTLIATSNLGTTTIILEADLFSRLGIPPSNPKAPDQNSLKLHLHSQTTCYAGGNNETTYALSGSHGFEINMVQSNHDMEWSLKGKVDIVLPGSRGTHLLFNGREIAGKIAITITFREFLDLKNGTVNITVEDKGSEGSALNTVIKANGPRSTIDAVSTLIAPVAQEVLKDVGAKPHTISCDLVAGVEDLDEAAAKLVAPVSKGLGAGFDYEKAAIKVKRGGKSGLALIHTNSF